MKHQSIQKKLLNTTAFLLGSVLLSLIFLLFSCNLIFKQVKTTVGYQNNYISYESSAAALQSSVTSYFDSPSKEKLSILTEAMEDFTLLAKEIHTFFQGAQFEDSYKLSTAYLNKIKELIDYLNSTQEDDAFSLYKQCSHFYNLMLKQYSTTLPFEMKALSSQLSILSADWNLFIGFIMLLICIIFLIIMLLTSGSIQKIARPLIQLSQHAKEIESQNYGDSVESLLAETSYSEIYTLTSAFIHMENTIREQIEALKDKLELSKKVHSLELENMSAQVALAQTENSLMQSLINPHFLFNCLNLLSSFAIIEDAPTVHEYSLQIAQYLRESLNYVGKNISLQKEFTFLSHYADIQKIRFGSRIDFQFHCDEDCLNAVIPAVILQPLVENALVHGVGFYLQDGKVSAHAFKTEDGRVKILIEDNGEGISFERQQEITESLSQPFEAGQKGTGLRSVLYRLNYFFHNEVEFQIESTAQETCITICIPFITNMPV